MSNMEELFRLLNENNFTEIIFIDDDEFTFKYGNIKYYVVLVDPGVYEYGIEAFDNNSLSSEFLSERFSTMGNNDDLVKFLSYIKNKNHHKVIYDITEKIYKLMDDVDEDLFMDIINEMFPPEF